MIKTIYDKLLVQTTLELDSLDPHLLLLYEKAGQYIFSEYLLLCSTEEIREIMDGWHFILILCELSFVLLSLDS